MWWDDDVGAAPAAAAPAPALEPEPEPEPEGIPAADPAPAPVLEPPRPAAVAWGPGKAENAYVLIYGKKGQGKTIGLRQLYASRIRRGGSGTFIDRTGRNSDLGRVVTTPAEWWRAARAARAAGRPFSLVLQPARGSNLTPFFAAVYELGDSLLAIDEAELYANAHRIDPELDELVSLGRNKRVDIAVTVRTPPELHGRLRGNADVVLSFCQPSRMYAESLAREFFHVPGAAELLLRLPKFHYLRAAEGNVTRGRLAVPWR